MSLSLGQSLELLTQTVAVITAAGNDGLKQLDAEIDRLERHVACLKAVRASLLAQDLPAAPERSQNVPESCPLVQEEPLRVRKLPCLVPVPPEMNGKHPPQPVKKTRAETRAEVERLLLLRLYQHPQTSVYKLAQISGVGFDTVRSYIGSSPWFTRDGNGWQLSEEGTREAERLSDVSSTLIEGEIDVLS